jgi:hypothetical protein
VLTQGEKILRLRFVGRQDAFKKKTGVSGLGGGGALPVIGLMRAWQRVSCSKRCSAFLLVLRLCSDTRKFRGIDTYLFEESLNLLAEEFADTLAPDEG